MDELLAREVDVPHGRQGFVGNDDSTAESTNSGAYSTRVDVANENAVMMMAFKAFTALILFIALMALVEFMAPFKALLSFMARKELVEFMAFTAQISFMALNKLVEFMVPFISLILFMAFLASMVQMISMAFMAMILFIALKALLELMEPFMGLMMLSLLIVTIAAIVMNARFAEFVVRVL